MKMEGAAQLPLILLVDQTKRCLAAQEFFVSQSYDVAIAETIEDMDAAVPVEEDRKILAFINPYSLSKGGQAVITYANMLGERLVFIVWTDWGDEMEAATVAEAFGLGAFGAIRKSAKPETMLAYLRLAYKIWALRDLSSKDFLTGLENRRGFYASVASLVDAASRYPHPPQITAVVIDVDEFKNINDRYSHGDGDRALQFIAWALKKKFGRASDHVCRPGGDEAWVVTIETEEQAQSQVDQLKDLLKQTAITTSTGEHLHLSISTGVAQFREDEIKELVKQGLGLEEIVNALLDTADLKQQEEKDRFHKRKTA